MAGITRQTWHQDQNATDHVCLVLRRSHMAGCCQLPQAPLSPSTFDWARLHEVLEYQVKETSWQVVRTWRDVEASGPLSDLGVLVLPQLLAVVQHHRGPLVRHAKLVGVHRHAGHPPHTEVKGGDGIPQLAGKGQDKAPQTGVHVQQELVPPCHLHMQFPVSCMPTTMTGLLATVVPCSETAIMTGLLATLAPCNARTSHHGLFWKQGRFALSTMAAEYEPPFEVQSAAARFDWVLVESKHD